MKSNTASSAAPDNLTYAMFVYAAYKVYEKYDSQNPDINPSQGDYPYFPEGYELVQNIFMSDFLLASKYPVYYGFIARSQADPATFVVAIRGTVGYIEWWDDIHVFPVSSPFGSDTGYVVSGFLDIFNTLTTQAPGTALTKSMVLLKDLDFTTLTSPGIVQQGNIRITGAGHSLGAALITLYAAQKSQSSQPLSAVYTYASPCVGTQGFADYYNGLSLQNVRVFNKPDLVPTILTYFFYVQAGGGIEVDSLTNPQITQSLGCFHYLSTYIFLLGGSIDYVKADGCEAQQQGTGLAVRTLQ